MAEGVCLVSTCQVSGGIITSDHGEGYLVWCRFAATSVQAAVPDVGGILTSGAGRAWSPCGRGSLLRPR